MKQKRDKSSQQVENEARGSKKKGDASAAASEKACRTSRRRDEGRQRLNRGRAPRRPSLSPVARPFVAA